MLVYFFFSSIRRHTRSKRDWSSDVCSSDLIFSAIRKNYTLTENIEITMECNPDDVTGDFCETLKQLPVNRISMGAQTFSNERLRFLHRRHNAREVDEAITRLRNIGIRNISIDLMFEIGRAHV